MKKRIFIALSIVLAVLSSCGKQTKQIDYLPCVVERGDDWGFVNSKGEVFCEDEFSNRPTDAAIDTPDNLARNISNENRFSLRISGDERTALDVLENINGIKNVKSLGRKERNSIDFIVETEPNVDVRPVIFQAMAAQNLPILSMSTVDMTLEDIFIEVTSNENNTFSALDENEIEFVETKKDDAAECLAS